MSDRLAAVVVTLMAAIGLVVEARAEPYSCGIDPVTDAHQCFRHADLRAEGSSGRYAPLYRGGPKGVSRTGYTVHANCASRVLILKDAQGVKFGAGGFSDTPMARQLGDELCNTPLPTVRKK